MISSFLFGTATALISTAVLVIAFAGFWYLGPIMRRAQLPPR